MFVARVNTLAGAVINVDPYNVVVPKFSIPLCPDTRNAVVEMLLVVICFDEMISADRIPSATEETVTLPTLIKFVLIAYRSNGVFPTVTSGPLTMVEPNKFIVPYIEILLIPRDVAVIEERSSLFADRYSDTTVAVLIELVCIVVARRLEINASPLEKKFAVILLEANVDTFKFLVDIEFAKSLSTLIRVDESVPINSEEIALSHVEKLNT